MKGRRRSGSILRAVSGYAMFFVMTASVAAVSVGVFYAVSSAQGSGYGAAVATVFAAVMILTAAFYLIGCMRKRRVVDKPVEAILAAAERMSRGDFRTRIPIGHDWGEYDGFDLIAEHLNRMAEELSQTEILRSDFVADVSHEIKTPLAVIRNYAEALAEPSVPEATKKEYTLELVRATEKLSGLVSGILKLNKLERKRILPKTEKFDLVEAVAESILRFEDRAEEKGVEFDCSCPDRADIASDKDLLDLIWNNLLSNAVKFTEKGGRISVSIARNAKETTVTVADSGCGMSEETGRRIFDKFWQGDTSHAEEGNGLGLALVKKVIDIVGGSISVKSRLGEGSSFTVTLKNGDQSA